MKKTLTIISILIAISASISTPTFAQAYDNDGHALWTPGAELTIDMFKAPGKHDLVFECELWSQLDVPATQKAWKKGVMEKAYFCAVMDMEASHLNANDPEALKYAQLLWDTTELMARSARKDLADMQERVNDMAGEETNGAILAHYNTALNDAKELGLSLCESILHNVIDTRNEENYKKYRIKLNDMLYILKDYATTEEDAQRFISGKADKGMKPADSIPADAKGRGEIDF